MIQIVQIDVCRSRVTAISLDDARARQPNSECENSPAIQGFYPISAVPTVLEVSRRYVVFPTRGPASIAARGRLIGRRGHRIQVLRDTREYVGGDHHVRAIDIADRAGQNLAACFVHALQRTITSVGDTD